jgi:hypothetical protein
MVKDLCKKVRVTYLVKIPGHYHDGMAIRRLTDGVDGHQMQRTDANKSNKQPPTRGDPAA